MERYGMECEFRRSRPQVKTPSAGILCGGLRQ